MKARLSAFFNELEKIALYSIPRGSQSKTFIQKAVESTLAKGDKKRVSRFGEHANKIYQSMIHKGYADPAVELAAKRYIN